MNWSLSKQDVCGWKVKDPYFCMVSMFGILKGVVSFWEN